MRRRSVWLALLPVLAACGHADGGALVLERAQPAPLRFSVQAAGELRSVHPTELMVPGEQWTARQLSWSLPDGSRVAKGELVARFSAEQSKQDLTEARIDIQRNALTRAGKQVELQDKRAQLGVELTQVDTQHAIAQRYANAPMQAMARNDILDAVQDERYLAVRQRILTWREGQSSARGKAELAVLDAQRDNYRTTEKQKQADLDALELRAPHAGVLQLEASWSGELPQVGGMLYAGSGFATLPDPSALEVDLYVPQIEAQGIALGDRVELHRQGAPGQQLVSRVRWVAAAAQPRGRESPVKYLEVKAAVPAATARQYGWVPGQYLDADIVLLDAHGYSVPNLALRQDGAQVSVEVLAHGKRLRRPLRLGVRGPDRSQVLSGLHAGDEVLLDTPTSKEAP